MRIENVSKSFGAICALRNLDVDLPESGLVGIAGRSGAGKTTLLRIIAGLEVPNEGCVSGVPDRISVMFEDDRLFPWMSIVSNVTLAGCDDDCARELLRELGLRDDARARIAGLSGGQRRRVTLARALAHSAPLYLLDEPTARLDEESAAVVLSVIERHCEGALVLAASHDARVLKRCCAVVSL